MGLFDSQATRYNAVTGVAQLIFGLMVMRRVIPVSDIAFPPDDSTEPETGVNDSVEKKQDDKNVA